MGTLDHQHPGRARRYDLDHLRVIAFVVLVVSHASNLFVGWGSWPVRSGHVSWGLERVMLFVCLWRLPLVFLIAGAGAAYNLDKRGSSGFLWERLGRLLPPLAAGIFLIAPLQTWLEGRLQGQISGGFLAFLPEVWTSGPAPQGMLGWQHLWFVAYLLVISFGLALLHTGTTGGSLARVSGTMSRLLQHRPGILLLGLIPAAYTAWLAADHPPTYTLTGDWWNLSQSVFFFLTGWMLVKLKGGLERVEAIRHRSLQLGLLCIGLLYTQDWLGIRTLWWWDSQWHFFTKGLAGWAWVLAIVGFSARHINRPHAWLKAANTAVFPFFLWHLAVLWGVGMFLASVQWSFLVELTLSVLLTLAGTALLVSCIRPFDSMRLLFGMPPRKPMFSLGEPPEVSPRPNWL